MEFVLTEAEQVQLRSSILPCSPLFLVLALIVDFGFVHRSMRRVDVVDWEGRMGCKKVCREREREREEGKRERKESRAHFPSISNRTDEIKKGAPSLLLVIIHTSNADHKRLVQSPPIFVHGCIA